MKIIERIDLAVDGLLYWLKQNRDNWFKVGTIKNSAGHYSCMTNVDNYIDVYSNSDNLEGSGKLYKRTGSLFSQGASKMVLDLSNTPQFPGAAYIRTLCIRRDVSGLLYGALHVGNGYPSTNGYVVTMIWSEDNGETWRPCNDKADERTMLRMDSDSGAFVLQDIPFDTPINYTEPLQHKFLLIEPTLGSAMALCFSNNGVTWGSQAIDMSSVPAGDSPCFVTFEKVDDTFHIITGDKFPVRNHRYYTSKDMKTLTLVSDSLITSDSYKGTSLTRDNRNQLWALTNGRHVYKLGPNV